MDIIIFGGPASSAGITGVWKDFLDIHAAEPGGASAAAVIGFAAFIAELEKKRQPVGSVVNSSQVSGVQFVPDAWLYCLNRQSSWSLYGTITRSNGSGTAMATRVLFAVKNGVSMNYVVNTCQRRHATC